MPPKLLELRSHFETEMQPRAPFSFEGTFHKPSHFPTPDLLYEDGCCWQSLRHGDKLYGIKLRGAGSLEQPKIELSIYHDGKNDPRPDFSGIADELGYRFDLMADIRPFVEKYVEDKILGPAIRRWVGMRVSSPYSFYEFLVITTVLQNTVVRRSVQMLRNLFENYGRKISFDNQELLAFWASDRFVYTSEEALRNLKVGYRAKTLKRQALEFESLDFPKLRSIDDAEQLRKTLLQIYGIGPATVQYMMFEVFHRYGALYHIPPWEQKIYSRLLFGVELVSTEVLLSEIDARWGEWKMLAMHYIFEDLFWKRKSEKIPWLEELIRL